MPTPPTANEVRQQFIDYFKDRHAHTVVPSSPVVPHDDPTLLFANAGMNQFKPYFLGTEQPPYPRAVDTQKCIRAGGKHNDLEDVGKDTYHHTFFEMLGNWSFGETGGYFKKQAIDWAWDLLTNVWNIDPKRLHATYFEGDPAEGLEPDHEARDLWLNHLPPDRVHPGNKKDNFWEMGDTGPCGPCSELHFDRTPDFRGAKLVNADNQDDVIEIWNLVFIQYNRSTDKKLTPLPAQHVDTGMGFERIVRVLQGKQSNYDTDVFTPLFDAIQKATGARAYSGGMDDPIDIAYRVLADHIRCLTFALTDGAVPSNEKRGYVLRSILRRAMFYGRYQLGVDLPDPFLYKLVDPVVCLMGHAFPELKGGSAHVAKIIREEEESFGRTIDRGIRLEQIAATDALESKLKSEGKLKIIAPSNWETVGQGWEQTFSNWTYRDERIKTPSTITMLIKEADGFILINVPRDTGLFRDIVHRFCDIPPCITGDDAFQLHDTYGFPIGLTNLIAEQRGMTVDISGFNKLMDQAREKSKAGGSCAADSRQSLVEHVQKGDLPETEFIGYDHTELPALETPLHVFRVGNNCGLYKTAEKVSTGKPCAIVLNKTPFYAEAGGQVGDTGVIQIQDGARIKITDTLRIGDITFHLGEVVAGTLTPSENARVALAVDRGRRARIMSNHTTTHVMNRALRDHVNPDAMQKGSLVDDEKLRFDFSHKAALTRNELIQVEQQVNADIASDLPVYTAEVPQNKAIKINSLRAVFGEKYPPIVRVVSIGSPVEDLLAKPDNPAWANLSIEFCGGTHLSKTGDAEGFVILSEDAVAKGVRRITALTGAAAHQAEASAQGLLNRLEAIKSAADEANLADNLARLSTEIDNATLPAIARAQLRDGMAKLQELAKKIEKQKSKDNAGQVVQAARQLAEQLTGEVIVTAIQGADANALRTAMDVIRKKHPQAALLLAGSSADDKVALMASVPKDIITKGLKAGDWVKHAAKIVGGGGGGRPDSAQAGGKDPTKIPQALETAKSFALEKLN
jgi:alanyl-tRNA synthetase